MAGTVEYRATLTRIAAEITNNDLEGLKFLCKSIIPDGKLEQIVRPTALFQALEECDKLGIHNVSFLGKILKEVRRLDLSKKLVDELGESAAEGREESSYTATPELELEKANLLIADTVPVYQASVAENLKKAMAWNEEAKTRFIQKKYQLAADLYSMAIDNVPKMYTEELAKYYKNRAVCRLKMERYKEAIDDCDAALHLVPDDVKSMFRRAKCLFETNRHVDAHAQILQARKNDPKNKEVASLWSEIERKVKDLLVKCEEYVSDGNICFGFGQTEKALELYTKAVNHCPYTFPERKASFIKCQANCHFEKKHHDSVLECCKEEGNVQSIVVSLSKRAKRREKKKRQKEKLKKTKPEGDEEEEDTAISQGQDSDLLNDEKQTSELENNTIKSPTVSAIPQTDPRQLETERENKEVVTTAGILEKKEHSGDDLPYSTEEGKSHEIAMATTAGILEQEEHSGDDPPYPTEEDKSCAAIAMVDDECKDAQKSHASHFPTLPNLETGGDEGLLPRHILLCCDKWQSWGESIPVINREMCHGLANNGHQVACLVLDASPIELEEAANQDVRLIKCSEAPDIDNSNMQLMYRQLDFPFDPDLVIGHGKLTGPVALHFAKKFTCCRLHILHDLPDETESFDEIAPSVQVCDEVKLASEADFVAAVGSYLKDIWSTVLNREVREIIPGLPNLSQRNSIPSLQCRCFVAAKFGSPLTSGLDLAVWALNNSNKEEHLPYKATLIARNTYNNILPQAGLKTLITEYDKDCIDLNVKTSVESRKAYIDLQGSTVFLYPARIDPFGVTTLDAIATGIPVLVSSRCGLAHLIKHCFDEKFHDCIVEVQGVSKREKEEDVCEWSKRVNAVFEDRERAFQFAAMFRSEWTTKYSWDETMKNLIRDLAITGNLPLASSTKRSIPPMTSKAELELVEEIGLFDKRQKFILFLSPEDTTDVPWIAHIALIRWACVFDFDQESAEKGYLAACDEFLQKTGKPASRLLPKDEKRIHLPNGIPWILLQGTKEVPVDVGNHMEWIAAVLQEVKKRHVQPITFLVFWKSDQSTKNLCKLLYRIFNIVSASPLKPSKVFVLSTTETTDSRLDDVAEEWETKIRHIQLQSFCGAIFNTAVANPLHLQDPDFSLRTADGKMKTLPSGLRWVDSELTVLYSSIGSTPQYGIDDANHFYRGGTISWYAIEMKQAVERESWEPLKNEVEEKIKNGGASCLLFPHQRGAGGTTSARKILYDFHQNYPCVCLNSITSRTQEAITQIWKFCGLPVIILADIKQTPGNEHDIDVLFDLLSNERVSCVIIHVVHRFLSRRKHRRIVENTSDEARKVSLAETLTDKEADDFVQVYSSQNKSKSAKLNHHRRASRELQIPFYYALVAFEDRFEGLPPFVKDCLVGLTTTQQSILEFLAMAHYYAQVTLPAGQFAKVLGVSGRALYSLEDHLPSTALDLLIEEEGGWQPRHSLISAEILRQLLSKPYNLHEDRWVEKLAEKAIEFVKKMDEDVCSRMLAIRDDDNSQRFYSSLVMDIPNDNDIIMVFQEAIKVFPQNPYIKVHLGRFISKEKKTSGFEDAIKYTNEGILCAEEFSALARSWLHQMKGMVYKRQAEYLLDEGVAGVDEAISFAQKGAEAFRRAVSIAPELCEQNYIPLVYMMYSIFSYVDEMNSQHGGFLGYIKASHPTSQFLRDSLLEVSDALECVPDSDNYPSLRRKLYFLQSGGERDKGKILKVLRDLKVSGKASTASVNREIVRLWYQQCRENDVSISDVASEMIELLNESLRYRGQKVGLTMRLWVKIAPHVPIMLPEAEEKVAMWRSHDRSEWPYLYKFVFACIRILEGAKDRYEELRRNALEDLRSIVSSKRRYDFGRIRHPERPVLFLGKGKGMQQIVTLESFSIDIRKERSVPPECISLLRQFRGTVTETGKVGEILSCDLRVTFRPDLCVPPLVGDSFKYKKVHFYLAFTCFGAEAYNVKLIAEN